MGRRKGQTKDCAQNNARCCGELSTEAFSKVQLDDLLADCLHDLPAHQEEPERDSNAAHQVRLVLLDLV